MGIGLAALWRGRRQFTYGIAGLLVLLGLAVLFWPPVHQLLFGNAVASQGLLTRTTIADSAGINFIASGAALVLFLLRRHKLVVFFYALLIGVLLVAVFNFFGLLYVPQYMYDLTNNFVMALNLAVSFMIMGLALGVGYRHPDMKTSDINIRRAAWAFVAGLVLIQVATYAAFNIAKSHNKDISEASFAVTVDGLDDTVSGTVETYRQALRAYRGFYVSSDNVSRKEFASFYESLRLEERYPGLRVMSLIAAVPDEQVNAFVAKQQNDDSVDAISTQPFSIKQFNQAEDIHFIYTLSSDTAAYASPLLGLDLTSIEGRKETYTAGLASNPDYASGTVQFPTSNPKVTVPGFFITTPVKNANSNQPLGLVNANFYYKDMFAAMLPASKTQQLNVHVQDDQGKSLFKTENVQNTETVDARFTVPISNREWQVSVSGPSSFGLTAYQQATPLVVLVAGQLLFILVGLIYFLQSRAPRQAMAMVKTLTADLSAEQSATADLYNKDQAAFESLGEGLIRMDKRGVINQVNPRAEKLLGKPADALLGHSYTTVLTAYNEKGNELPLSKQPITKALAGSRSSSTTLYYEHANGDRFPARVAVSPVRYRGKIIGAVEVFNDISAELQAERAKDDFMSIVSHQLSTPATAVKQYLGLILEGYFGKVKPDQLQMIQKAYNYNEEQIGIIGDMLEFGRLDRGAVTMSWNTLKLRKLVAGVVATQSRFAEEKNITIVNKVPATLAVHADERKFTMCIVNLVNNAIKYGNRGGRVAILAEQKDEVIRIAVQDNGNGIAQTDIPKLFQRFSRLNNKHVEGSGLGLYVIKKIVQLHHGKVWVESEIGKGSTFIIQLPVNSNKKGR